MTETRAGYPGPSRDELWIDRDVTCTPANVLSTRNTMLVYPYETPLEALILSMATADPDSRTKPFLQHIQLQGPRGVIVRATGQVDDGAMRNCMSKTRWEQYSHCLEPMEPSSTWIKVANDARIKSLGQWKGNVKVGGIQAESSFEIFNCKNAFDIILGKPWLKKVHAVHDYSTDTITIGTDTHREALVNFDPPRPPLPPISSTTFIITNEQDPEHTTQQELEARPLPPNLKIRPKHMWIPQLEFEEQKCQRLRAQAQHEHEHHEMLRKACERAMDAREKATKCNIQRANDESSKDQLEAEWNRIKLMQISDDPWAETRWATFLNLTDARDCDPE